MARTQHSVAHRFDDPSETFELATLCYTVERKSPFWLRTITEQLLSTNLFIATRKSIGVPSTRGERRDFFRPFYRSIGS